jgi:hypothetical protein
MLSQHMCWSTCRVCLWASPHPSFLTTSTPLSILSYLTPPHPLPPPLAPLWVSCHCCSFYYLNLPCSLTFMDDALQEDQFSTGQQEARSASYNLGKPGCCIASAIGLLTLSLTISLNISHALSLDRSGQVVIPSKCLSSRIGNWVSQTLCVSIQLCHAFFSASEP